MARTVNKQAHESKRNAILDAAQRSIITKGYEQMAIADVLGELGISSGAFYHYFDCKASLLNAVAQRMGDQAAQSVLPIIHDPCLSALEKLNGFFNSLDRMKLENKTLVFEYMRAWYADENAILRHKLHEARIRRFSPLLEEIIDQGIKEGVFTAPYPDQTARLILAVVEDLGMAMADLFLSTGLSRDDLPRLERIAAATADALERLLGAPPGALGPSWGQGLARWVPPSQGIAEE